MPGKFKHCQYNASNQVVNLTGGASASYLYDEWGLGGIHPSSPLPIQSGDRVCWSQSNSNVVGGIFVELQSGYNMAWRQPATDGQQINQDYIQGGWQNRCTDLSQYAGDAVVGLQLLRDLSSPPGDFALLFSDVTYLPKSGSPVAMLSSLSTGTLYQGSHQPTDSALSIGVEDATGGAQPKYYLDDHLGTAQMELSSGGWPLWQGTFTPFGQEIIASSAYKFFGQQPGDGTDNHYKFTGTERDSESGLDDFGARYYASTMGRFMSPDPVIISPELDNPQSWNKYSYTFNRPLSLTDPDGKWPGWYHAELDRNFFGNQLHMSMHDQQVIVNESALQDSFGILTARNGQSTENVKWHGMDDFWNQVGPAQAMANTETYISQSLNQAVYWQLRADYEGADCSSCHDAALQSLADAEHAGQDLSSPEHRGKPWTMWGGAKHWYDERHSAMSSDASDEVARAEAVYETQVIYSRYQNQLKDAKKKQKGPPSWNCIVNASCH